MEPFERHPFVKWQKEWRGDSLEKKNKSWTKREALYSKPSIFHDYNLGNQQRKMVWAYMHEMDTFALLRKYGRRMCQNKVPLSVLCETKRYCTIIAKYLSDNYFRNATIQTRLETFCLCRRPYCPRTQKWSHTASQEQERIIWLRSIWNQTRVEMGTYVMFFVLCCYEFKLNP